MTLIQVRRDTATNWATSNPILLLGEIGWDSTNKIFKVGDGSTAWSSLPIMAGDIPTVSSATTLTMTATSSIYVFTGSSATTWTLPAVAGNTGRRLIVENRGSAAITLTRAGTDQIWLLSALTSVTIAAGGSCQLVNDGTYWNMLSVDNANNTVGVLPVANGGTGRSGLSWFRAYRTTTTGVSIATAGVQLLPASFFNNTDAGNTSDYTFTSATNNQVQVANAGVYEVGLGYAWTNTAVTSNLLLVAPAAYVNGTLARYGGHSFVYDLAATGIAQATFRLKLAANDLIQPGIFRAGSALSLIGEATGTQNYFEVTRVQ